MKWSGIVDQQKFIQTMELIKDTAMENNNEITKENIDLILTKEGVVLEEDKLKLVYAYLKTSKIKIKDMADGILEEDTNQGNEDFLGQDTREEDKAGAEDFHRDEEFVRLYKADIKSLKVLDDEELLRAMENWKENSENIVNSFLGNVIKWVKAYSGRGVLMSDLIQEGNICLVEAVRTFDYEKAFLEEEPVKLLKVYLKRAVVKGAIEAVDDYSSEENVGYKIAGRVNAVNDCAKKLAEDYGRKVTIEEVAEKMELTYDEVKEIVNLSSNKIEYINCI